MLLEALESNTRTLFGSRVNSIGDLFDALDTDRNGAVSRTELLEGLHRLDIPLNEDDLNRLLAALDGDRSGNIEKDELVAAFAQDQSVHDEGAPLAEDPIDRVNASDLSASIGHIPLAAVRVAGSEQGSVGEGDPSDGVSLAHDSPREARRSISLARTSFNPRRSSLGSPANPVESALQAALWSANRTPAPPTCFESEPHFGERCGFHLAALGRSSSSSPASVA